MSLVKTLCWCASLISFAIMVRTIIQAVVIHLKNRELARPKVQIANCKFDSFYEVPRPTAEHKRLMALLDAAANFDGFASIDGVGCRSGRCYYLFYED